MAQKSSGRGPSSAAGIVTYYDADNKKAFHFKPTAILIVALAIGIAVYVLNLVFKLTTGA